MSSPLAYYNENDPFCVAWLTELIKAGLIADGVVDDRDIQDVRADELEGYTQCHFFAGIGGWSYALRLAGWPDDKPVWTGSCPCQPFSSAGKGAGADDARHLWPEFFRLIAECKPSILFGEQVEAAIGHGWWDAVQGDLEGEDYACGMAVLGAHSVGAFHRRQRCYFVGESCNARLAERIGDSELQSASLSVGQPVVTGFVAEPQRAAGRVAIESTSSVGTEEAGSYAESGRCGAADILDNASSTRCDSTLEGTESQARDEARMRGLESGRGDDGVGHPEIHRHERECVLADRVAPERTAQATPWADSILLPCIDGKLRPAPVEPALFPLAYGISSRVGLLRGAGNAIVPQVAAEFIRAYTEITRADLRYPRADAITHTNGHHAD